MGMNFVVAGGALVPMDGKALVLPGTLPNDAITRAHVVRMGSFGLQFYAAMRQLMPASWVTGWTSTLLTQKESIALGSCVKTVHLSNILVQAISTSSSLSTALSAPGDAGLATWAASVMCDVIPEWCTSGSESVIVSQSAQEVELVITTRSGDSLTLLPLLDPFAWVNSLDSPSGGNGNNTLAIGLSAGFGGAFFLGAILLFILFVKKRRATQVKAVSVA
jgi:hypothetical protein